MLADDSWLIVNAASVILVGNSLSCTFYVLLIHNSNVQQWGKTVGIREKMPTSFASVL